MKLSAKRKVHLIAIGFLASGIFILMQVVLPLISFQFWLTSQKIDNQVLLSPVQAKEAILGVSVENKDNFPAFISTVKVPDRSYNKFNLSVPRLKISGADVYVDSNDLSIGLAHLPGAPLPGEKGNVFISGHSSLRPSFSIKKALFSNLTDLKKGDQIIIDAPSAKFVYEVIGFKIIDPSDLSVISPPDTSGRYISLMTCVPPGLNLKRLVVLGKML